MSDRTDSGIRNVLSLRKIAGDFERIFRRNVPRNVLLPVALLIVVTVVSFISFFDEYNDILIDISIGWNFKLTLEGDRNLSLLCTGMFLRVKAETF